MRNEPVETNDSENDSHRRERSKQPVLQSLKRQHISNNLLHSDRLLHGHGLVYLVKHSAQGRNKACRVDCRSHHKMHTAKCIQAFLLRNLRDQIIHLGHWWLINGLPQILHHTDDKSARILLTGQRVGLAVITDLHSYRIAARWDK